jgi:para-aminobenzoate synthetase component 1
MTEPLIEALPRPHPPLALFEAIRERPGAFLLDSAMVSKRIGRYSFVGCDPFLAMRSKGRQIELATEGGVQTMRGSPFRVIGDLMRRFRVAGAPEAPPLAGGAVGYLGYDLRHFIERLPALAVDDVGIADCCLGFYDWVVAFDHFTGRAFLVSTGLPETGADRRRLRAQSRLAEARRLLSAAPAEAEPSAAAVGRAGCGGWESNFSRADYLGAVRRTIDYIAAGDIFQANISQRLSSEIATSPWTLYRRLRAINPAPFAAYLDCGDPIIVSASPERFLRVTGRRVETRPIKGTRPRGRTPFDDRRLASELLASAKDRAEHVMIVDLERNDLGRVCKYGSVRVSELAALETYATVFHLTSTVNGRLLPGKTPVDLLRASFPGGSITGAPKVRAMEIIDELEPTTRGVYTGGIGYLSFTGDVDLNIVIRTFVITGGRAYFQVGGGIVADSDPEAEYQETLDKAKALIEALEVGQAVRPARAAAGAAQ